MQPASGAVHAWSESSIMIVRRIYEFLSSVKLAMALLVAILACSVVGVTVFRGERAWTLIFSTTWFNALLVLLVINVACCFFPRIRRRRFTVISFGMILFHLSFVIMLAGIVYNSLFYFRGIIRLTEGETLQNGELRSWDSIHHGRFFDVSKLKGETTLVKMHRGYTVGGEDKVVAYEISVGETGRKRDAVIYVTKPLDYRGFTYFVDKEGYSVLIVLYDKIWNELYGGFLPLQSLRQKDDSFLYTTGTKEGPGTLPFPYPPAEPLFDLQAIFVPNPGKERTGEAHFSVWAHNRTGRESGKPLAEGSAPFGEKFFANNYYLSLMEVRYWVGMNVKYEPGQSIILASLWVGFGGMVITFVGRLRRGGSRHEASDRVPDGSRVSGDT